jgi:hypothetical protein
MRPAGARRPGIGLTELATRTRRYGAGQPSRLRLDHRWSRRLAIQINPDKTRIVSHAVSSRGYTRARRPNETIARPG